MKKKTSFLCFIYHLILYGFMIFGIASVIYSIGELIINLIENEPITWEIIKNGMTKGFYHAVLIDAFYLLLYLIGFAIQFYFFMDDTIWKIKQRRR